MTPLRVIVAALVFVVTSLVCGAVISSVAVAQSATANQSAPPAGSSQAGSNAQLNKCDWGSVSDIVQTVASVANIVLLIWFFAFEVRKQTKDKTESEKREKLSFRIRSLVLEPNIQLLHDFFDANEEQLNNAPKTINGCQQTAQLLEKVKEEMFTFKKRYRRVQDQVIDPLLIVSPEFSALKSIMLEIEDVVTVHIGSVFQNPTLREQSESKIRELRVRFLKCLFEAEDRAAR